jgi:hypothetical protein
LEFGWIGIPIVFCFFGWVLIRISTWAAGSSNVVFIIALGILLLYLPHFARGSISELPRPIVRYVLLPIGLAYGLVRFRGNKPYVTHQVAARAGIA